MHVLLDARLLHRSLSGLERVQRNLLRELAARPEVTRLRALVRRGAPIAEVLPENVELVPVVASEDIAAVLLGVGDEPPDVFHMTFFPDRSPRDVFLPALAPACVVSVTDAILNRHPEYHPNPETHAWYDRFVRALVSSADRVLSYTASAGREAVDDVGADPGRVDVTPLSIDPSLRARLGDDEVARRLGRFAVEGDYFVAVGKDYPHKDHATMFRALAALDRDARVVIAGQRVWRPASPDEEGLDALLERIGLTDRVRWIHGLSDEDVKALLQGSRGLLYPSLEEGFGLPPLEAMALGVPVAAAASMSIPEVCGDAALLFPPGDDAALADRMRTLLDDADEVRRLVERGAARIGAFTWEKCAEGAVASYRRAIAAARSGRPAALGFDERMALVAACPFRTEDDLAAWQERCRHAEQHAWNLEDQREELLRRVRRADDDLQCLHRHVAAVEQDRERAQRRAGEAESERVRLEARARALEEERDTDARPIDGPRTAADAAAARPRFSLRRRIGKIRRALNGRSN